MEWGDGGDVEGFGDGGRFRDVECCFWVGCCEVEDWFWGGFVFGEVSVFWCVVVWEGGWI